MRKSISGLFSVSQVEANDKSVLENKTIIST